MKKKILYVEDEPALGRIVRETLESRNYEVTWESDGNKVIQHLESFSPDICILDIMLPNIDGYTLCKEISSLYPGIPIIFLTARAETTDLVKGFASGGSDYIKKPFSLEELVVRIENQLRLNGKNDITGSLTDEIINLGLYRFIPSRYELHTPHSVIKLSQRDMQVLSNLVASRNRVIDRRELLLNVWGDDSFFNSRNLDVYIRKIREYFSYDSTISIQTLKGKGYLFLVP
jgi:DNA-binding response OmpR family regulator